MTRRLSVLRYVGLAASTALAGLAYLAGALPSGDPAYNIREVGLANMSAGFRWGTLGCAVAAIVWLAVWGGLALPTWRLPNLRWMTVTGALWALPLLLAPPLASRDAYSYACQGWLYARGADPYVIGSAAGSCPWLGEVAPLWRETTTPYGSLWVALSAAASAPADAVPTDTRSRLLLVVCVLRIFALAGVLLAGWGGARLALACGGSPRRAVVFGALSPLVGLHAISGAHNDALMAGLVVAGLALIARRMPPETADMARTSSADTARTSSAATAGALSALAAGAALGLATAIKVTAVVAVPFAVVLAVRAVGGRASWARATAAVGAGVLGSYGATMALTGLGFGWLRALSATAKGTQWTSVPTAFGMTGSYVARAVGAPDAATVVIAVMRGIGVVVLAGILVALWARAVRNRADVRAVVTCCGLALVAVAGLSPVFYPWYALTALAVLGACATSGAARRRLVVAGGALMLLVLPNGLGVAAITKAQGAVVVTIAVTVLAVRWLRRHGSAAVEAQAAGVLDDDSPGAGSPTPEDSRASGDLEADAAVLNGQATAPGA